MVDEVYQYNRLAPYIEQRGEMLLGTVFGDQNAVQQSGESDADFQIRKFGRAGVSRPVPAFKAADLTTEQLRAIQMGQQGLGTYAPFLQAAEATTGMGLGALQQSQGLFAPTAAGVQRYMDPYQEQVTQRALADIDRQGQLAQQAASAQAVSAGAFGGAREGIQRAELARNLQDIKSQRIVEDRSRNFQQAQQLASQAFENQQARTMQAAPLYQGLGGQYANLGASLQGLQGADIGSQLQLGTLRQTQAQNVIDAARQTRLLQQQEPFERLQFASGILTGTPASQMTVTQQPSTSPLMQTAGLGILGLAAMKGINLPSNIPGF
tara:strand:- start:4478 stop:5446 length:969 start_codon:yes stop_codon:yes gene_type:complete